MITCIKYFLSIALIFIINVSPSFADAFEKFHKHHDIIFTTDDASKNVEGESTVVVVGGGPAGLASAIALKKSKSFDKVIVLEKRNQYTREQIANISKHALLSMIELEPRILIHLLEIGRAFFYDEHIIINSEMMGNCKYRQYNEIIPLFDLRPFQSKISEILGFAFNKTITEVSSLNRTMPPLKFNTSLLNEEKSTALPIQGQGYSPKQVVLGTPINDLEHALNFVAAKYFDIRIQHYEVDWQTIERQFEPDLFIDATGSTLTPKIEPRIDPQKKVYNGEVLNFPAFANSYLAAENLCVMFPWMFHKINDGLNFSYKNSGIGHEWDRTDKWESVFHQLDSINSKTSNCTITVGNGITFVIMPNKQLSFELRRGEDAFLRTEGLEFSISKQPYFSSAYVEAEKALESFAGIKRTKVGEHSYFFEDFTDLSSLSADPIELSKPLLLVGDRAFQGLAYLGLGAGNSFSIYANVLSNGLSKPYSENYEKAIEPLISKNYIACCLTYHEINKLGLGCDPHISNIIERQDNVSLANSSEEIREALNFLEWVYDFRDDPTPEILNMFGWAEAFQKTSTPDTDSFKRSYREHLEEFPHFQAVELQAYLDSGLVSERLRTMVREAIEEEIDIELENIRATNTFLAKYLKVKAESIIYKSRLLDKIFMLNESTCIKPSKPLKIFSNTETKVYHFKQFHYSLELELGSSLMRQDVSNIKDLAMTLIEPNTPKEEIPLSGSVACALKKMMQAIDYSKSIHNKEKMDTPSFRHALILEDYLREASIDIANYLEYGPRFELIVESQRKILMQLHELHKQTDSIAIIDESLLEYNNYNKQFDVTVPYGEFYELPENRQNYLVQRGYSPLHQYDGRFSERSFRKIRKVFKYWVPGKETLEQAQHLFRFGAGVVFHAITKTKIFPANSADVVKQVSFNPDDRCKDIYCIYDQREADTASRVQKIAKQGYQNIILIYGEGHDFKNHFKRKDYDFQEVETVTRKDHIEFFKLRDTKSIGYSQAYLNREVPSPFSFNLSSCDFSAADLPDFESYRETYRERVAGKSVRRQPLEALSQLAPPPSELDPSSWGVIRRNETLSSEEEIVE